MHTVLKKKQGLWPNQNLANGPTKTRVLVLQEHVHCTRNDQLLAQLPSVIMDLRDHAPT